MARREIARPASVEVEVDAKAIRIESIRAVRVILGRPSKAASPKLPADFVPSTDDMTPAIERGVPEKKVDQSIEVWRTKRTVEQATAACWHGDLKVGLSREHPVDEPAPFERRPYTAASPF